MAKKKKTTFYTEQIKAQSGEMVDKIMAALALQVEGQTKANIVENNQVDTAFMLNSVYTVTKDKSGYKEPHQRKKDPKVMAPQVEMQEGASAAVAVGAEYAAWQELKNSFLVKAAEQVASQSGTIKIPMLKDDA